MTSPLSSTARAMVESKTELIFHPLRMRILQTLLRRGRITAGELGESLSDVPPATLYRHLNRLAAAGVIEVVEERPIRGAVERVYAVHGEGGASLSARELERATREDHVRFFAVFLAGLLRDFEQYVEQPEVDLAADGVGYRQFPLELSDAELVEFLGSMNELIRDAMGNPPRPDRRRRVLTRILMPWTEEKPSDDDSGDAR